MARRLIPIASLPRLVCLPIFNILDTVRNFPFITRPLIQYFVFSITKRIADTAVDPKKKKNSNAGTVDDIVALIDSNPNGPEEAGKAIFKQLKAVNPEKQILALELLTELGDKSEKFRRKYH